MVGIGDLMAPKAPETEGRPGARPLVIDLRSPAEFAEDHVPGAHNVPLFDDEGRAVVGLFYKQFSPEAAFSEARALVVERIAPLVERIAELVASQSGGSASAGFAGPPGRPGSREELQRAVLDLTSDGLQRLEQQLEGHVVEEWPDSAFVLHCWRGGLRSRSVVGFLRGLGFDGAYGLQGGYKAYRRLCMEETAAWQAPPAFVLRGWTGVGKTLVLRALERRRPEWVMDLEAHAGHRSSLLGMVGLEPTSQKGFETRIHDRLCAGFDGAVVFEGESRKVGDVIVPPSLWEAMQAGENIELVASTERRVQVLLDDYLAIPEERPKLRTQLAAVEARMERRVPLVELFDAGREDEVVRELLEHYYDPLYRHSERGKRYALRVDAEDPERAAAEVEAWIEGRIRGMGSA